MTWEELPDIELYMDQVITLLDGYLAILGTEKAITQAMINNYVKGDCIPSPISKKYNKEHIALILQICLLKRATNISDIKQMLDANK